MALEGSSKSFPICLSDSSPISVPASPVKLLTEERKRAKCRRLVLELESSCDSSDDSLFEDSPSRNVLCKKRLAFSSDSDSASDEQEEDVTIIPGWSESPIYEVPSGFYTGEQILKILLNPRIDKKKICHSKPCNVSQSSTFVVDLESLQHPDDIKKDDFGKWIYSGSHSVSYAAYQSNRKLDFERLTGTPSTNAGNIFQLRRINCNHPANSQCQRLLAFVTAPSGDPHHLCLLSYNIPPGFSKEVASHGNSKQKVPFYPTLPSTKCLIQKEISNRQSGPKHTVSIVSQKVGGVTCAISPCDLPRNERQISYLKSRSVKPQHSGVQDPMADQVFTIMQQAKLEDHTGKFVRDCRPSPEPAFVLSRDWQLNDLVRFCTVSGNFSVLTVDPTFNLGDFDVTPTAYHHLLLKTVRYGTSPVFIGPTLMHYRKNFGTYLFFASSLIGLRPELRAVQAFGTDGEKALADAFGHEYRYASRLSCFIHCRRNIKQQLRDRHFPDVAIKSVLDDIFGVQQDEVFAEGLVDCTSDSEFSEKLHVLEKRWNDIEACDSQISRGFYNWFIQHKSDIIKSTMLRPVREEAGLGCPPKPFTTNPSEAVNAVIKNQVSYKSHQLIEFMEHLKAVVDEQDREVERAVIGRGKYRFKEQYSSLQIPESQWFKMTEKQRLDHIKKVANTKVIVSSIAVDPSAPSPVANLEANKCLSVDVNTVAASVSVPLECLKGIWQKAEELLNSQHGMSPAPGQPEEARMVLSRSGKRPHLVLPCKGGRFKCDSDCLNFKSLGICSHSVAVAECNNLLTEFLAHFQKVKKKPNFTAVSLHGVPAGCGKKGGVAPRKRRKLETTSSIHVDRLESTDTLPSSSAVMSGGTGNASPLAQVCGASTVNISLDTQAGPSYTLGGSYSSWTSPYYDWGYQPYFPPPRAYAAPFSQCDTCVSPEAPCMPPPSAPSMGSPPMANDTSPFNLHFISGNISKCAGCGNKYVKPAVPPYDLCIQHREWRSFSAGGMQQSKFAPAYYHVNTACIRRNWPSFTPEQISVTSEVSSRLNPTHREYLFCHGFFTRR